MLGAQGAAWRAMRAFPAARHEGFQKLRCVQTPPCVADAFGRGGSCAGGGRKTAKAMTSRRPEEAVRSGVVVGEDVLGSPGPAVLLGHGDGAGSPALPQLCSAAASVLAVLLAVLPPPVAARAVRVVCWCQYVLYQPS